MEHVAGADLHKRGGPVRRHYLGVLKRRGKKIARIASANKLLGVLFQMMKQGLTYDEALASNLPIVVMRSEYTDELIDDPAIGMSFQKRGDLVKGVLYYLDHPDTQETITKRQQKLHDISSEVFGQRVMDFYLECQQRLQDEQDEKKRQHHLFGKRG